MRRKHPKDRRRRPRKSRPVGASKPGGPPCAGFSPAVLERRRQRRIVKGVGDE